MLSPTSLISKLRVQTLRQEFRQSLFALFLMMIVVYSLGLFFYFLSGVDTVKRLEMKNLAMQYADQIVENGDIPAKDIVSNVIMKLSYEQLPAEFRAVFPKDSFSPYTLNVEPMDDNEEDDDAPEYIYFGYAEEVKGGQMLYLVQRLLLPPEGYPRQVFGVFELEVIMFAAAGFSILIFLVVFHLLTRRVNAKIDALQNWADQLKARDPVRERPDFKYKELNKVADHLASSINRVARFVDREHAFLRHASHELRTPITIISGNAGLLEKMIEDERQTKINGRIQRASHSMKTIIATLLWLGREREAYPDCEDINLADMLTTTIEDHRYLLAGKEIDVTTDLSEGTQPLPAAPLEIILANIIRNAFQHTQEGRIEITSRDRTIIVANEDNSADPALSATIFEMDKGIGLSLVRRMAERLGWDFEITSKEQKVIATLSLNHQTGER